MGGMVPGAHHATPTLRKRRVMILLGAILLILGWVIGISILSTVGTILLLVGVVLFVLNAAGHGFGGRHWY